MTTAGPKRFSFSILTMMSVLVLWMLSSPSSSSSLVKTDIPCAGSECCIKSNRGPGPLNLTKPEDGFDSLSENQRAFLYHCVRYFTHFRWYCLINATDDLNIHDDDDMFNLDNDNNASHSRLVPFPWGQGGRVMYRGDNQTVVIPKVRKEDEGVYVFFASNETHSISGKFRLKVDCSDPDSSFAEREEPVQSVSQGSSKTLMCVVNKAYCSGKFYQFNVFWLWHNFTSGGTRRLKNSTLPSVSIVCDRRKYLGGNCSVLIRHVGEELFDGEFVCKLDRTEVNQTVRLAPVRTYVKSWLPYELGFTGGAVLLMALMSWTWRYGHRLAFYCRSQPDRGNFEADAAILHGEDHEELVRDILLSGVRALGYDVLEEVTKPGRLELPDQLNAVEKSHSVILTFSAREIAEDGHIDFLNRYVFSRKTHSTVIFIRCPDNITTSISSDDDDNDESTRNGSGEGENSTQQQNTDAEAPNKHSKKNPWKNEALQAFKILDLPSSLCRRRRRLPFHHSAAGSLSDWSPKEARDEDKFWYSLQNHLPKPPSGRPQGTAGRNPGVKERRDGGSSSESNARPSESHPLMKEADSVERTSAGDVCGHFGTFPSDAAEA